MLKKIPWKTVVLTILCWSLFWEIKETITGERMFFLNRWFYSELSHAKDIEVLAYYLTDEQVIEMLAHPDESVHQPSEKELQSKEINVVMRIRNLSDGIAWGRLSWASPENGVWKWNVVDVPDIPGPWRTIKYADIIIPTGKLVFTRATSPPEPIKTKWDALYVHR